MEEKTNVMRYLQQQKIPYVPHSYAAHNGALSAQAVADVLNQPAQKVFKTLVTVAGPRKYYVFVIPSLQELDLKKAAHAAAEKSIAMLPAKELLPLTGYVHGGCSPIGMKKTFPTFVDASALQQDTILFSAGKIGYQVEVAPQALRQLIDCAFVDLV